MGPSRKAKDDFFSSLRVPLSRHAHDSRTRAGIGLAELWFVTGNIWPREDAHVEISKQSQPPTTCLYIYSSLPAWDSAPTKLNQPSNSPCRELNEDDGTVAGQTLPPQPSGCVIILCLRRFNRSIEQRTLPPAVQRF
jgi:hypothetical protein